VPGQDRKLARDGCYNFCFQTSFSKVKGNSIQKQKMAFTGHVLRGSSGEDVLQILEGKLEATTAQ